MQPWAVEYGTLWGYERSDGLPPVCPARIEVEFDEIGPADIDALRAAMNLPTTEPIEQRFRGRRRCFSLKVEGQIACYGWVTQGVECVGELERQFNLGDDEAYIWDCATLPAWRGQRLYSALLSQILHQFHAEGIRRLWIGASQQNAPSVQGIANAGFQQVVDVVYRRWFRLTYFWMKAAPTAPPDLVSAACHIMVNDHERQLGSVAIGYKS